MVDYSKWDALEVSDDDADIGTAAPPLARRLDQPSSVTIGPTGPPEVHAKTATPPAAPRVAHGGVAAVRRPSTASQVESSLTHNGGFRPSCAWRQDRTDVVIHAMVPAGTRARQVAVTVTDPSSPGAAAGTAASTDADIYVGGGSNTNTGAMSSSIRAGSILSVVCDGKKVLCGRLSGRVSNPDEGNRVVDDATGGTSSSTSNGSSFTPDWELVDEGAAEMCKREWARGGADTAATAAMIAGGAPMPRLCQITLRKRSAIPGTVQWWSRLFEHDEEIDIAAIADRRGHKAIDAWKQANARFKDAVQKRHVGV